MRALPVALLAVVMAGAGAATTPASASDQVGPIPMDQPPVASHSTGGDTAGIVVTAGRSPQRADGVQLAGACEFSEQFKPNTNDVVMVVSAQATAASSPVTAYGHPTAVGVTCDVIDRSGQSATITVSASQPGTSVVTGTAVPGRAHAYDVCMSMNALYSDNVHVVTERVCLDSDDLLRVNGQTVV